MWKGNRTLLTLCALIMAVTIWGGNSTLSAQTITWAERPLLNWEQDALKTFARNNYDKVVFNGDIGRVTAIDGDSREVAVSVDGREVVYDFSDLDEIVPAYAVSVHKSQGSEYPVVIIPIVTQHYILLQRNLIYTAVTRGKKLVIIVGSRKAMAIGINNTKTRQRYTRLRHRLGSA
jgi:exodeoxyribonuclease V alpha subunit